MAVSAFKYAQDGKVLRGRVDFAAEQEVTVPIKGPGIGGNLRDYSVLGLPIVAAQDTITIDTAVDAETYSVTVRGKTFTVTAGASSTPTTIRNLLKTALDLQAAALKFVTATVSTDGLSVTATVPGVALGLSVTAETPENISVARGIASGAGTVGIVDKTNSAFTVRAAAAMTAGYDLAIVG